MSMMMVMKRYPEYFRLALEEGVREFLSLLNSEYLALLAHYDLAN